MAQTSQQYNYFPRSVSWQVATLLNPSLTSSVPHTHRSTPRRPVATANFGSRTNAPSDGSKSISCLDDVKPVSSRPPPSPPTTAYRWWHHEGKTGKLAMPPQYVSPTDLYKAMPRYTKKVQSDEPAGKTIPFLNATSEVPLHSASPGLSPRLDLAAGSPRSSHSSRSGTPRSVLDAPRDSARNAPPSTTRSPAARSPAARSPSGAASPASVGRSRQNSPPSPALSPHTYSIPQSPRPRSASAGGNGTPLLINQSPRSRSAATSPSRPDSGATVFNARPVTASANTRHHLQTPQTALKEDFAQGSPLSPANSVVEVPRLRTPPVALPPTPPVGRLRRVRPPHPIEPTVDVYKKFSPNTYATNTVWNERRDSSTKDRPRRTILITSKDGTKSVTSAR